MGRAVSPAQVRKRKEAILDSLAAGHSLARACKDAKCPESTSHSYRMRDSDFAEEVNRLLSSPEHVARIANSQGFAPTELDRKERFLWYYEGNKDRVVSCHKAGIKPTELDHFVNPTSEDYDSEFTEKFKELLRADEMRVEDVAMRKAIVNKESAMVRFILGDRDKKGASSINVAGDAIIISDKKDGDARSFLSEKFGQRAKSS